MRNLGCLVLIVAFIAAFITFCYYMNEYDESFEPSIPIEPQKMEIRSVMEHRPECYSIRINGENKLLNEVYLGYGFQLFEDVPDGQPMWVLIKRSKSKRVENYRGGVSIMGGEIHIHNIKELNGGGWERRVGKFQTVTEQSQVIATE